MLQSQWKEVSNYNSLKKAVKVFFFAFICQRNFTSENLSIVYDMIRNGSESCLKGLQFETFEAEIISN